MKDDNVYMNANTNTGISRELKLSFTLEHMTLYLSNIKRSLEVSDKDSSSIIYRIAFSSMNHLIKLKENELPEDFSHNDFVITDEIEIENLMEKLKDLAFKEQTQNHTHEN